MKILQVIPKLGYGGAETGCYDLAHYLAEQDCKSYIITSGGELLKYVRKDKVKVIKWPVHSKNPIIILVNVLFLTLFLLIFRIDIVHARSRAPAWSCYFSCAITRKKFVTTFHGTYSFKSSIKKYQVGFILIKKILVTGAAGFIGSALVKKLIIILKKT